MSKKIDPTIATLAGQLGQDITWTDGAASLPLASFYAHAPEGVTPQVVQQVDQYSLQYQRAALLAVGQAGQDHLRANPEVAQVPVTVEWGMGTSTGIVRREAAFTPPNGGDTVITHGGLSRVAVTIDSWGSSDAFKSIKDHLKLRGAEILGG